MSTFTSPRVTALQICGTVTYNSAKRLQFNFTLKQQQLDRDAIREERAAPLCRNRDRKTNEFDV